MPAHSPQPQQLHPRPYSKMAFDHAVYFSTANAVRCVLLRIKSFGHRSLCVQIRISHYERGGAWKKWATLEWRESWWSLKTSIQICARANIGAGDGWWKITPTDWLIFPFHLAPGYFAEMNYSALIDEANESAFCPIQSGIFIYVWWALSLVGCYAITFQHVLANWQKLFVSQIIIWFLSRS